MPAITAESNEDQLPTFWHWCSRKVVSLVQASCLERHLPSLLQDADTWIANLTPLPGATAAQFDPFDGPYRLVYQFTMRVMGVQDVADSPELLRYSLGLYDTIAQSTSPLKIIFPHLPTPAYLRRLSAGVRLYRMMSKIVAHRLVACERKDDALQQVMDEERSPQEIVAVSDDARPKTRIESKADIDGVQFLSAAVFAGNLTNAYIVAWTLVYLASDRKWQTRVRQEVQQVLRALETGQHRANQDGLSTLTPEQWEKSFPSLEVCQKETIRLQHVGCFFRRNVSGKPLAIGSSGEMVPAGAFVVR